MFNKTDIAKKINHPIGDIILLNEIDSTNTYIKKNVSSLKDRTIVCAKRQTDGRGRRGKSFLSPDGGLYFSILIKSEESIKDPSMLTVVSAVAVSKAIESICHIQSQIKWVNDIFIDGRKCCGILCESGASGNGGKLDYIIVGIGINVIFPKCGFDSEITDIACALSEYTAVPEYSDLIATIFNNLIDYSPDFNPLDFINEYKQRSCIIGQNIFVLRGKERIPAKAIDINESNASLLVKYADGHTESLLSGDVSIRTR